MKHSLPQRALAETLGTALLVLIGPGSVVATLARGEVTAVRYDYDPDHGALLSSGGLG